MPEHFSNLDIFLTGLLFVWTGFVRSGLGFGGAALGLPLMLMLYDQPIYWLPIIGFHLLFFSSITFAQNLQSVDWAYIKKSGYFIFPSALIGVMGLISLPNQWLLIFIYTVTLIYAFIWSMNWAISSSNNFIDKLLLILGGYVAGTSLTGAPLMIAVYARNVVKENLRNTLFVLWFILVTLKMTTFAILGVELHFFEALILLPVAAIGHFIGLKFHAMIIQNDQLFKRVIGGVLGVISAIGLWQVF
ncbi:MAG: TSUP family transporter [Gammaproteobacteria bacterium]|nr:TSUP family transporter [Gammaproteobacteria bacterium]